MAKKEKSKQKVVNPYFVEIKETMRSIMFVKEISVQKAALAMRMCPATFYIRMKDCSGFTLAELEGFAKLANISIKEFLRVDCVK